MTDAHDEADAILGALDRLRQRRPHGSRGRGGGPHDPAAHGWGPRHRGGEGHDPERGGRFGGMAAGGPARMRMLVALDAASRPLSVSDLGAAIGVDQPRASRLVQSAVELGLVRREADPDDARRTLIALTADGAREAQGFRAQRRGRLDEALAGFSDQERADLGRLLSKLAESWPQP